MAPPSPSSPPTPPPSASAPPCAPAPPTAATPQPGARDTAPAWARSLTRAWHLPAGTHPGARWLLASRGLRGFADGYVAVLLPVWLQARGWGPFEIGALGSLTLAGSAATTLALAAWGHRVRTPLLMALAAVLMAGTGLGFAWLQGFWPLALVALLGTLNPSSGDVSLFLPLEHAQLAQSVEGAVARTALFTRHSLIGALSAALGALASGLPAWLGAHAGWAAEPALRAMFLLYAGIGAAVALMYRQLHRRHGRHREPGAGLDTDTRTGTASTGPTSVTSAAAVAPQPLGASRGIVMRLVGLFSVDAFAGGLLVNSQLALWLLSRHGLGLADTGRVFFVTGLLGTASMLLAAPLARRIGLVRTMVWTHIPANLFLIGAALAGSLPLALGLLFARAALAQMDVPARTAFVMAVVTPAERAAAASATALPRSLASAAGPSISGALQATGWLAAPLLAGGLLKIAYDLALLRQFKDHPVE